MTVSSEVLVARLNLSKNLVLKPKKITKIDPKCRIELKEKCEYAIISQRETESNILVMVEHSKDCSECAANQPKTFIDRLEESVEMSENFDSNYISWIEVEYASTGTLTYKQVTAPTDGYLALKEMAKKSQLYSELEYNGASFNIFHYILEVSKYNEYFAEIHKGFEQLASELLHEFEEFEEVDELIDA